MNGQTEETLKPGRARRKNEPPPFGFAPDGVFDPIDQRFKMCDGCPHESECSGPGPQATLTRCYSDE